METETKVESYAQGKGFHALFDICCTYPGVSRDFVSIIFFFQFERGTVEPRLTSVVLDCLGGW